MEEISSEIEACKSPSIEPVGIARVLVRLQNEINWQFLRPYPELDQLNFFNRFWNFLLFTAAHPNTSVRLAAYRTTGAFLFKVTPYYPKQIMKTFADIALASTIDMKSSAIIASSFAFISNFNAIPYLQDFLRKTPVFHHFSISDPIFSEHLAPIIRNLGRLGFDWLCTLLHSFLEKAVNSGDRYRILSIAAIIKHEPLKLMNELLIFIRDQSQVENNLGLVSYLFSSIDLNYEMLDLSDIIEAAVNILANFSSATATEIDSSFQILAICSPSFSVDICIIEDNENLIKIEVSFLDNSIKKLTASVSIAPYLYRPSFFLLPLPLKLLQVNENDGVLQLTSKFKTMAKIINKTKTNKEIRVTIFNQFSSFLSANYNDRTSACMQGFAICLPAFLKYNDECNVVNLTKHIIFARSQSWFHSSDILRIIKAIPYLFYGNSFKTSSVLDVLIGFSMSTNEKLCKQSLKVISRIVNNTDFARETLYIAKNIDYFDNFKLGRILNILISIITARTIDSLSSLTHLHFLVLSLLEFLSEYQDDTDLFIVILNFFSCFDLTFVDISQLRPCFLDAFAIVHASLSLLTGLQWDSQLDHAKLERAIQVIDDDMKSMNYDIISETAMDYSHFLSPFASSLKFIYALPTKMVQLKFIKNLFNRIFNLFPLQSALFVKKYWEGFTDTHRNEVIQRVYPILEYVQDYSTVAIWCNLFLTMGNSDFADQLTPCKEILHRIAKYAIEHNEFYCEFFALEIYIVDNAAEMLNTIEKLPLERKNEVVDFLSENHVNLLHKLRNEPQNTTVIHKRGSSVGYSESVTELIVDSQSANTKLEVITEVDEVEQGAVIIMDPVPQHNSDSEISINGHKEDKIEKIIKTEFNSLHITFNSLITKEMLSSPLVETDILNPVIKTQLTRQTFHFTDEQLHNLARSYIHTNDIFGLNTLIKYAFAQRRLISVKGFMFPNEIIPLLFRYLKRLSSPELDGLIKYYQESPSTLDIEMECRVSKPVEYFEKIKSNHLSKKDIADFNKTLLRLPLDQVNLLDFSIDLLNECKSMRRTGYVLALCNTVFERSRKIPLNIIEKFISIINEKFDIIPGHQVAHCFLTLSNKIESIDSNIVSVVKKCYTKCEGRSSGLLRLHQSLFKSSESTSENHILLTATMLKSEVPSMICASACYIYAMMKEKLPDSIVQNLLKQNLPFLTEPLLIYRKGFPVSEDIGVCLTHILNSPNYKSHYPLLLSGCSNLIPSPDCASFAAVSICLRRFVALHREMTDDLIKLYKIADSSLVTKPGSSFLFKIYLNVLRERANKAESDQQKETFISDYITSWMQNCKDFDCYMMAECVFEWENLIFQYCGLEPLLSIVCYQFCKYMPRFFPLFAGFGRFVRRYITSASKGDRAMIKEALKSAALINTQRAHAMSLLLIDDREWYRTALDLASFPMDCAESETIINSTPELLNILSTVLNQ